MDVTPYSPTFPIRFVTAASLFDGHDAAINIMRRILQGSGAEVVHLGHNRSVQDIVSTAIQEDVHAIAVSSYQGGHMEFFTYMVDLLAEQGAAHIQVYGGGGGVIVEDEIERLEAYGVAKIFSPDDGMRLGLQGMINHMLKENDRPIREIAPIEDFQPVATEHGRVARLLTLAETRQGAAGLETGSDEMTFGSDSTGSFRAPVIGITGTGGAGKSTLTDELVRRFVDDFDDLQVAILCVDPTRRSTGGALLGDRIRMNAIYGNHANRIYMRSFATRQAHRATSEALRDAVGVCRAAGFDIIFLETAGIGQSDTEISEIADVAVYVMTHDFGAPTQLEKIGMLDVADFVVLNKFERKGSADALRDIRKQVQRNRGLWHDDTESMPVFPTMASHFNDPGVSNFYLTLLANLNEQFDFDRQSSVFADLTPVEEDPSKEAVIPPRRQRYLAEIVDTVRGYHVSSDQQCEWAAKWEQALGARVQVDRWNPENAPVVSGSLQEMADHWWAKLHPTSRRILEDWDRLCESYRQEDFSYSVRGKKLSVPIAGWSQAGLRIPRVALPPAPGAGDRLRFAREENLPGYFPFTAGVYPFKRAEEDPTRMFAGEGSPERTNKRFHLVSLNSKAKRLSTAFDSVTLYGADPEPRPDIYGKVGNAGVSICTLDDMKKLYSGFDLCDPATSVSMTINGPAPMILAMFLNTAIDQQVEKALRESDRWEAVKEEIDKRLGASRPAYIPYDPEGTGKPLPDGHDGSGLGLLGTHSDELVEWGLLPATEVETIRTRTLSAVRGTVQADILKEDQAQNTCLFSTEFALKMMGDIQQFFVENDVRNYYSVSVSGYHIAEAGANPVTQLALTLANGFTYVEYYLARGMDIDSFAPNLSFFFSNGLDPEYTVLGRVARRIWSIVLKERYGGNERSQKLKYHIQTSGRSLHAQEIQFNDIRTTLQGLLAVADNCNSLHTNAYDEAITTPTEESVRRAMAIQLIINREFGLTMNENPLQGSFVVSELTDLTEKAVLEEFERINDRGGVLGAMETMYQRGKIQEESMLYERKKHDGEIPIVGVNTFLSANGQAGEEEHGVELMRSTDDEKQQQIQAVQRFNDRNSGRSSAAREDLKRVARRGENVFETLMDVVKYCSLGQVTRSLFEVGGAYRRSM